MLMKNQLWKMLWKSKLLVCLPLEMYSRFQTDCSCNHCIVNFNPHLIQTSAKSHCSEKGSLSLSADSSKKGPKIGQLKTGRLDTPNKKKNGNQKIHSKYSTPDWKQSGILF